MIPILRKPLFVLSILFIGASVPSGAQVFESAVAYMDYITKAKEDLTFKYLFYMSAVSHGKSARKVEKRRIEVVNSINETKALIMAMPAWKSD